MKSTAVAPVVTCARLSSRPPIITTSRGRVLGERGRDRRRVGEHRAVAARPGSRRASSRLVVEPSSSTTRAPREQRDRGLGERAPSRRCRSRARCANVPGCGAGGERAAVHALHEPLAASSRRSRRIVSSDTPSSATSRPRRPCRRARARRGSPGAARRSSIRCLHVLARTCMLLHDLTVPGARSARASGAGARA